MKHPSAISGAFIALTLLLIGCGTDNADPKADAPSRKADTSTSASEDTALAAPVTLDMACVQLQTAAGGLDPIAATEDQFQVVVDAAQSLSDTGDAEAAALANEVSGVATPALGGDDSSESNRIRFSATTDVIEAVVRHCGRWQ